MVGTQAILVSAIVDSYLDGHGGVNQTDDRGGDADEVGVTTVRSAREANISPLASLYDSRKYAFINKFRTSAQNLG